MRHEETLDIVIVIIYLFSICFLGVHIARGWVSRSNDKLFYLKALFRCETDEQCRSIQKGSLFVKRLKQWSVMTSLGVFLFAGDLLSATIQYIESLEQKSRPNLFWRWSVGWFQDPTRHSRLIEIWKLYDAFESVIFCVLLFFAVRWSYADARCRNGRFPNFFTLLVLMCIINTSVYFGLWSAFGDLVHELNLSSS